VTRVDGGEHEETAAVGGGGAVLAFQATRRCALSQTSAAVSPHTSNAG
jgi:hypothetical protein